MPRKKCSVIEYRTYDLPPNFPVIILSDDIWRISDIPSSRLHFHNCLEIGLCESDSGTMRTSYEDFHFSAGDITFVGTDIPHTTFSDKGTASKWIYIYADVQELLSALFPIETVFNQEQLSNLLVSSFSILSKSEYPQLHSLLSDIIIRLQQKKASYQLSVRGLMLAFINEIMDIYKQSAGKWEYGKKSTLAISPALAYIREHYKMDFPIDILAQECRLSPTHFRRLFSSIMGMSPLEYLIHIRIQMASSLLRNTEMSVLEISEETGFLSVSSFNRHFLKIIGYTPSQWRKNMSFLRNNKLLKYNGWLVPPDEIP